MFPRVLPVFLLPVLFYAKLPSSLHEDLLREGHASLPGLISSSQASTWLPRVLKAARAEEAACALCSPAAAADPSNSDCYCCAAPSSSRSFYRARRLEAHDAGLAALPRLLAPAAAAALAVPRVRFYQWSAFIKAPGDAPSSWHQDSAASPLRGDKAVTIWLALSEVPASAGPLIFASRSHLPSVPLPSLRDLPLVQRLAHMAPWTDADIEAAGLEITPARALAPGDATVHLGWTLHAAPPNTSPGLRVAVALQYVADGARVYPDLLSFDDFAHSGGRGGSSGGSGSSSLLGIRFDAEDGGPPLYVRLLADDAITWSAWLRARPPLLIPGQAVAHDTLLPLVYDEEREAARSEL